jgi:hypothetical protein
LDSRIETDNIRCFILLSGLRNIAIHTIQQAQHHRLAINFLSTVSFSSDNHPIFNGKVIHLLLHVPMVPSDSLLHLFKLHPFPLPHSGSHVFVPDVDNNILAISSGFNRYLAQLSNSDLGCHVENNIYLCENHVVLNQNLNTTGLGSLSLFDAMKQFCKLEIHKRQ